MTALRVAIVGGGWAGLACAVRARQAGHEVALYEMAAQTGGRARSARGASDPLDNGQHILIGAYRRTLALMRDVGVDLDPVLCRLPLTLQYGDGRRLALPPGPAALSFARGVLACTAWRWPERLSVLVRAARWLLAGFRCDPALTVDALCAGLPPVVREMLIEPLCVAALNTRSSEASAEVLLRVLRDGLFGGAGGSDLLLPRRPLDELLPGPAERWLRAAGAQVVTGHRVSELRPAGAGWAVGGQEFDRVVLACTATEAARLAGPFAADWARRAQAIRYEPIVTVYFECRGTRLPAPMTALVDHPGHPAQFVFDHGALGGVAGRFAAVASGARAWVDRGLEVTAEQALAQLRSGLPESTWPEAPRLLATRAEKRATFRCVPGLDRPPPRIVGGLLAAGDYVQGPYPATLEGAVISGERAAAAVHDGPASAGGSSPERG